MSRNDQKQDTSNKIHSRRVGKDRSALPSSVKKSRSDSSIKVENITVTEEEITIRVKKSHHAPHELITAFSTGGEHDDIRFFFTGDKRGFEVVNMGRDASRGRKEKRSRHYQTYHSSRIKKTSQPKNSNPTAFEEAISNARMRGKQRVKEILSGDDMLSGKEFGDRLGLTRQAINDRRNSGHLIGLEGPSRGVRYPDWQIKPDGQLTPGITDVLALVDGDTWAAYRFLVEDFPDASNDRLIDKLQNGDVDLVLNHIETVLKGGYT